MTEDLKHIIESLLFVAETPLTVDRFKTIIEGEDTASIRAAIEALQAEYAERDGGFVLKQVAGGYQFRTQSRYNAWIKRLIRPNAPRLSKAALETLAIIAYNQPIIRSDIEHIRGVDSGGVMRMLMERKLIRVLGRKEIPGRPLIYATTKQFLEVFELKDLKDLPTPKEIEELSKSHLEDEPVIEEPPDVAAPAPEPLPEASADDVDATRGERQEEV
jgi:segregation and condensation protein B